MLSTSRDRFLATEKCERLRAVRFGSYTRRKSQARGITSSGRLISELTRTDGTPFEFTS